jgi:hypothetical protein
MQYDAMTLQALERALKEQDEMLLAARTEHAAGRSIVLPLEALRDLREACRLRCPVTCASTQRVGIRC